MKNIFALAWNRGSAQAMKLPSALAAPLPHIRFWLFADIAGRDVEGRSKDAHGENLHREEFKSGQTLRGGAMNIKRKTYMRSTEFKARQLWLGFTDAVGIALEVMAEVKEKTADWFKAWVKEFRTPRTIKKQKQLKINFLGWLSVSQTATRFLA